MPHSSSRESEQPDVMSRADFEARHVPSLGAWLGTPAAEMPFRSVGLRLRRLRLKHWQYISISSPDVFCGVAVADLHYVSTGFAYVYLRDQGRYEEFRELVPLSVGTSYDGTAVDGRSVFNHPRLTIEITQDQSSGKRKVSFDAQRGRDRVRSHFTLLENDDFAPTPLTIQTELADQRPSYTYKAAGVPVRGAVYIGPNDVNLRSDNTFGCVDWTMSYATRVTQWNWACAAGRSTDGEIVGFNLARGIHETAEGATENAVWIGGELYPVRTTRFSFDPLNPMKPWGVKSDCGKIRARFRPEGSCSEDVNLFLVTSRFVQPFGQFRGRIEGPDNRTHELEDVFGVVEDHYARW